MASRENLIPTTIVDKNGRTTTVHKKLSVTTSTKALPSAGKTKMTERRKELLVTLATEFESARFLTGGVTALTKTLKSYPDELLERLNSSPMKGNPSFSLVRLAVTNDHPAGRVSEMMLFANELEGVSSYVAHDMLNSLHRYEQLPETEDFYLESDEVRAQALALLKVQMACTACEDFDGFRFESGGFVIDDDALVDFVVDHPEMGDQVAAFIRERKSVDLELMSEVFADETPLSNGAL